jgi:hypothetical protein
MRSRQLHLKEVHVFGMCVKRPTVSHHVCVLHLYSHQDYLLTMHFSLLECLEAYHKVCRLAYSNPTRLLNSLPPSLSLSLSLLTDHLAQLIQLSGGSLVSSVEESTSRGNSTTCVVCDEERFVQLPSGRGLVRVKSGWILDCLSNYR